MRVIDRFCALLGGASAFLVAGSFLYVCGEIGFLGKLVGPPDCTFIGLFGIISAMLIFAAAHLIKVDL